MSALAKSLLTWHGTFTVQTGGHVWVPEKVLEKWVELARRELSAGEKSALDASLKRPTHAGEGGSR